jgi:cleavage and polyadenylation specificity factor subunit 2
MWLAGAGADGSGDCYADVRVTAHAAGHSLGGAVWHICVLSQDFVYAVHINLKSDRHLTACRMQQLLHRPALLITDAGCGRRVDPEPTQGVEFCALVVVALRRQSGHVVVPVDTASRVLDLLLLLEHYWAEHKLQYPIVFLCKTGASVLSKAKAQLEFLSEKVQQACSSRTCLSARCPVHVVDATMGA